MLLLLLLLLLPLVVGDVGGVVGGGVVVFVGFGFGVVVGVAPDVAHKTGQQQQASQRCRRVPTATGIWTRRCNTTLPHTTGLYCLLLAVDHVLQFYFDL